VLGFVRSWVEVFGDGKGKKERRRNPKLSPISFESPHLSKNDYRLGSLISLSVDLRISKKKFTILFARFDRLIVLRLLPCSGEKAVAILTRSVSEVAPR
jgi:hypothetical protein